MNLLKWGSDWLQRKQRQFASEEVIYIQDGKSRLVSATIGHTVIQQDDGAGAKFRLEIRDYLINADDLDFGDGPVLPKRGDRIEEITIGGVVYTYEVMANRVDSHWRYSDPFRVTIRVHTKLISSLKL